MIKKVDANCTSHLAELLLQLRSSTFRKKMLRSLGQFYRQHVFVTQIMLTEEGDGCLLCVTQEKKTYLKNLSGQSFKGQSIKEIACFDHQVFIRARNNKRNTMRPHLYSNNSQNRGIHMTHVMTYQVEHVQTNKIPRDQLTREFTCLQHTKTDTHICNMTPPTALKNTQKHVCIAASLHQKGVKRSGKVAHNYTHNSKV